MHRVKKYVSYIAAAVLCAAVHAPASFAGQITGAVKNAETGNGVHGASVFIRELNRGTITGGDGTFTLPGVPDGRHTVRASLVGYGAKSVAVVISGDTRLDFILKPSPALAGEVVTTARGHETLRRDIPGSVEVLGSTEIEERTPVSIPEALSRKPGLTVGSDMPWSQRVVIRGMSKDKVILFVDGCRVVTATETAAEFGTIAAGDIERVEVLKGPISVLYGSGSTGGVINVITRKGRFTDTPRVRFSLNPTFESASDGLGMYARAEWSSSRAYISLSQSNRDYGSYTSADAHEIANTQFRDHQTQVNVGLKLTNRHLLEVRHQDFKASDVGIPGARSFPENAKATYPVTTRRLTDVAWTWQTPISWWKESRLNGYYQPIHRDVMLFPNTAVTDSAKLQRITPEWMNPGAYHRVSGARWQNVLAFGRHSVVAGVEGWRKNLEPYRTKQVKIELFDSDWNVTKTITKLIEDRALPYSEQQPVGVFAEDAFDLGTRLKVTVGGRYDFIHTENELTFTQYSPPDSTVLWDARSDNDRSWSLVTGAVYRLRDGLDLNLTFARSFRAPTIEERYLYADLGGVLTVGNPALNPEQGVFAEGGFTAVAGNGMFSGQAYINSLRDMVTQTRGKFTDGRDAWISANAGEARLWGFETSADWVVNSGILVSGDFSFVRGTDVKEGRNLPFMPPPRGHISVRWNLGDDLWVEPLATFVYRQDKVAPEELTTPGYGIADISFGKTFPAGGNLRQDFIIGVKNIGDRLYRDHLTTSRGYEMYGQGRSIYTSLRVNFN